VLHGTSGIPEEQVSQAVLGGITKTNIATEFYALLDNTLKKAALEPKFGFDTAHAAMRDAAMEYLIHKQRVLNPKGIRVI